MVTADEIRQRVEKADQARAKARADTAAEVAAWVERRTLTRSDLAEVESETAARIEAAGAVMTVDELATFTGIPITELRVNGKAKAVPVRKARTPRALKVRVPVDALEPSVMVRHPETDAAEDAEDAPAQQDVPVQE